jgi:dihydrodipicolinate synthase/N-acetylneuraminate lyase
VPRAKVTATSGQLSAFADGAALGATTSVPALSNAATVRLRRLDQARRRPERLSRLMLTR